MFSYFLVPSAPLDLRLSDASAGEATLRWKDPEHKNGRITDFILWYYSRDTEQHEQEIDSNANEVKVCSYVCNLSPTN